MMITMQTLLLVAALVCFILNAIGVPSWVGLLGLGLACWILTLLLLH